ncbi:MAG: glycoside hydrolase family 125 protein [Odoribacter sp.]|nr:glycoside hydrolase family 125 protein [Odoribacter sp.]
MVTRRDFLKKRGLALAVAAIGGVQPLKAAVKKAAQGQEYISKRPPLSERHFTSQAVEKLILDVKKQIKDPKLSWMFENCFPNTLDTTVKFSMKNGKPDTFVITGDINAMWLRDSAAQVFPYLPLCSEDEQLRLLIAGVINRQTQCILLDPYANAFTEGGESSEWQSDLTKMKPGLHERKWEIDSLCYPVRLAHAYWKNTNDTSVFDKQWQEAVRLIYQTFTEQQRKEDKGHYRFQRTTPRKSDTLSCDGWGQPVKPVGMIVSCFRPSDDSTDLGFLVPSNLFAVKSLQQIADISRNVTGQTEFVNQCEALAKEVAQAVQNYAIGTHPKCGKIYGFEADGFGNTLFMDDANIPSLLALPYLECVDKNDPIYKNTRAFVWSDNNPYFFKGTAGEGIGGPHIGYDMVWHMSIIMKAMTSDDNSEIKECVRMLRDTDGGTGFMHESFHKDDATKFTRHWFAWTNTLFGELIVKLIKEGKTNLLNSL